MNCTYFLLIVFLESNLLQNFKVFTVGYLKYFCKIDFFMSLSVNVRLIIFKNTSLFQIHYDIATKIYCFSSFPLFFSWL